MVDVSLKLCPHRRLIIVAEFGDNRRFWRLVASVDRA